MYHVDAYISQVNYNLLKAVAYTANNIFGKSAREKSFIDVNEKICPETSTRSPSG